MAAVASQVPKLGGSLRDLARVVPFYAAFLIVMASAGLAVARLFRLDAAGGRAVIFTGAYPPPEPGRPDPATLQPLSGPGRPS